MERRIALVYPGSGSTRGAERTIDVTYMTAIVTTRSGSLYGILWDERRGQVGVRKYSDGTWQRYLPGEVNINESNQLVIRPYLESTPIKNWAMIQELSL